MKKIVNLSLCLAMLISLTGCGKQPVKGKSIEEITEFPIVYVNTINNSAIDKLEKVSKDAEFKIVYTDGTEFSVSVDEDGNYPMTIKGRGNSTWELPTTKKPYNIKFEEKVDLFGFGKAKKWSLIACWLDTSITRSYIGYKLARSLDEASPDCEMVELVINGVYEGVYMLCEAYGINDHRVETKGDGIDLDGDGEVTEFLVEADVRALEHNEPNKFLTPSQNWMVVKEPDEEEIVDPTDERYVYISDYINKVDDAIVNGGNYEDLIDLDSLASQYVVNEFLKNPDYGYGGQPYYGSTFMYMEEGGKLYFGPFWDCDICLGRNDYADIELEGYRQTANPEGYLSGASHWIKQLLQDEKFVAKVKEKWALLKPEVEKMINTGMPELVDKLSLIVDYDLETHYETYDVRTTSWGGRDPLPFEEECDYVLNFMKKSLQWMDQEFGQ